MDPRTGKTKSVLDAVGILALKGKCERVVVVTTLDGIGVWQEEIETHFPFTAVVKPVGDDVVKFGNSAPRVKFFLLNYDQFRKRSRSSKKWVYPTSRAIEAWGPDVVVFDESHHVKRAGGVTAQLAWRSVRRMRQSRRDGQPFVILATGTPNPKGWIDLFAQLRVMDDTILGTAKSTFEDRYCEYGVGSRRYTIVKYKRIPELKRKLRDHSFVISEEKAFPDMPPQLWQNVPVVLPPKARRIYNDMAEELVADFEGGTIEAANTGARRLRLLQITGGFTTQGDLLHSAKVEAATSISASLSELGEAFIWYARFLPETHAIGSVLSKLKVDYRLITGAVSRRDRRDARQDFRRGDTQALVFQVQAGSQAIDLATAHEVIYYSLPDGWLYYWQSTRRVRGPKQTQATRFRHLIARNTLDRSVLNTLQAKGDMHAELMRSPRTFLFGA